MPLITLMWGLVTIWRNYLPWTQAVVGKSTAHSEVRSILFTYNGQIEFCDTLRFWEPRGHTVFLDRAHTFLECFRISCITNGLLHANVHNFSGAVDCQRQTTLGENCVDHGPRRNDGGVRRPVRVPHQGLLRVPQVDEHPGRFLLFETVIAIPKCADVSGQTFFCSQGGPTPVSKRAS